MSALISKSFWCKQFSIRRFYVPVLISKPISKLRQIDVHKSAHYFLYIKILKYLNITQLHIPSGFITVTLTKKKKEEEEINCSAIIAQKE